MASARHRHYLVMTGSVAARTGAMTMRYLPLLCRRPAEECVASDFLPRGDWLGYALAAERHQNSWDLSPYRTTRRRERGRLWPVAVHARLAQAHQL